MKLYPILLSFAAGLVTSSAQQVSPSHDDDPVLDAIQEFNSRRSDKPNEVMVVLDPVGQPTAPVTQAPEQKPLPAEEPSDAEPVQITGRHFKTAPAEDHLPALEGLVVRVEKFQQSGSPVDPSTIKLLAPFPAKALAPAPAGWKLDVSDSAPPFSREVELADGAKVALTIRPHVLIPDSDGAEIFTIKEPGYDDTLGYAQTSTVGAILSNSIRQLEDDSKELGAAIDSLQQLLISLPKPPEPEPTPPPAPSRKK